jgi:hypothetical protein
MTEAEWLAATDSRQMLVALRALCSPLSPRKRRLFEAECFRHLAHHLPHRAQRAATEYLEEIAEGRSISEEYNRIGYEAFLSIVGKASTPSHDVALRLSATYDASSARAHAVMAADCVEHPEAERAWQCQLLRELRGNPFQYVNVHPSWITDVVSALAQDAYDRKAFDHVPVLADALEDAGRTDAELLGHLRGPGPHVRGCWAVDLILSKDR